jgi:gliding motility-associated-like protein
MLVKNCFFLLLLCLLSHTAKTQLCQGSLGDPIVNITFGSGSNPGPSLPAVTGYQYISGDCPSDGFYTVRNNTSGCFGSTWFSLSKDHTGDTNGYFMLVNASVQPSVFYLDTVKGLCGNTTYEFAAWIMNILKSSACGNAGIQPNLTFRIENTNGSLLKSYNTNNIQPSNTADWKQYGFFFTTPSNVNDIVLRITNNSQGGCGNDLALDDITFRPCGPLLIPSFSDVQSNEKNLCEGDNKQVTINCTASAGFNNPSYQWQQSLNNGITWTDISGETSTTLIRNFAPAIIGNYMYRLTAAEAGNMNIPKCRIASTALTIKVNSRPTTNASNNGPICEQQTLLLNAGGGTQYAWTGPDNFSSNSSSPSITNIQQANAGKYYVKVIDNIGCSKTDSTTVTINIKPAANAVPLTTDLCEKDSVQLNASGGISFQWQPSAGLSNPSIANPKASPADTTQYMVIATALNSCTDTALVNINVIQKPVVDAGADKTLVEGQSVQLFGNVTGNYLDYYWTPVWQMDDPTSLNPIVNPLKDTFYVLNAMALNGCGLVMDSVRIKVYKNVIVPNAFSPNGDGINDSWQIEALSAYPKAEVLVFNREGKIVFRSFNYVTAWNGMYNGKKLPVGTYYYIINLKLHGSKLLSGWLQIVQ